MHFLHSIIGRPSCGVRLPERGCVAMLTEKGFAVCEPLSIDTGSRISDMDDPLERCEFRRGHIHIRVPTPSRTGTPDPCWNLNLVSGWIVILPFQDLPPETRQLISGALPEGMTVPAPSVKPLQRVLEAYRAEARRRLRLRDALADAGLPSPVILHPTGLHSAPLRIYSPRQLRPLPLPYGHRLSAILLNWSGQKEVVEFNRWPVSAGD
ncbi:MAG: hypothetical protein EOP86_01135 [Verrucomicrobiaceae bacterium]|nr:MAG: hypothetical protein EOP86_01135 [Verrucomicrobiaceae bacterium]